MAKSEKSQIQKFREAARSLECDESETQFDTKLAKIARHKPTADAKLKKALDDAGAADLDDLARKIGNKD